MTSKKFEVEAWCIMTAHILKEDLSTERGSLNLILEAASQVNHAALSPKDLVEIVNYVETC